MYLLYGSPLAFADNPLLSSACAGMPPRRDARSPPRVQPQNDQAEEIRLIRERLDTLEQKHGELQKRHDGFFFGSFLSFLSFFDAFFRFFSELGGVIILAYVLYTFAWSTFFDVLIFSFLVTAAGFEPSILRSNSSPLRPPLDRPPLADTEMLRACALQVFFWAIN